MQACCSYQHLLYLAARAAIPPLARRYADQLVEARKAKQLTKEQAYDLLQDLNMFGGLIRMFATGLNSRRNVRVCVTCCRPSACLVGGLDVSAVWWEEKEDVC